MATQALGISATNFTLDPNSAGIVIFPVVDTTGAALNVSSGWTIKAFQYRPATTPNCDIAAIDLSAVGTFTFGNGIVTWNVPNNCGINPQTLVNNYALLLSHDGGSTGSLSNVGQFTWDVENYILPV